MAKGNKVRYWLVQALICITFNLSAQTMDTLYFDEDWEKSTKDKAYYYRPMPLNEKDGLLHIKDYYINGQLQMRGRVYANDQNKYEGKIEWFYLNGDPQYVRNYTSGKRNGPQLEYDEDGDLIHSSIYRLGQLWTGTNNCFETYEDGNKVKEVLYYSNTSQKASEVLYQYSTPNHITYFNKAGERIGTFQTEQKENVEVYFYNQISPCGHVLGIKRIIHYRGLSKEGPEQYFSEDGTLLYEGLHKDGKSYSGTFYKGHSFNSMVLNNYEDGVKEGREVIFNMTGDTLSNGMYKEGKPFSGSLITRLTSYPHTKYGIAYECANYVDGMKTGMVQIFERSNKTRLLEAYNVQSGEINGKRSYYDSEGNFLNTIIYKDGKPWEGTINKKWSELQRSQNKPKVFEEAPTIQHRYEKGKLVSQRTLNVVIPLVSSVEGLLKNGKPYQGYFYFQNDAGIKLVDFYEKGLRKIQYSQRDFNVKRHDSNKKIELAYQSVWGGNRLVTGKSFKAAGDDVVVTLRTNKKLDSLLYYKKSYSLYHHTTLIPNKGGYTIKRPNGSEQIVKTKNDLKYETKRSPNISKRRAKRTTVTIATIYFDVDNQLREQPFIQEFIVSEHTQDVMQDYSLGSHIYQLYNIIYSQSPSKKDVINDFRNYVEQAESLFTQDIELKYPLENVIGMLAHGAEDTFTGMEVVPGANDKYDLKLFKEATDPEETISRLGLDEIKTKFEQYFPRLVKYLNSMEDAK